MTAFLCVNNAGSHQHLRKVWNESVLMNVVHMSALGINPGTTYCLWHQNLLNCRGDDRDKLLGIRCDKKRYSNDSSAGDQADQQ